MSDTHMPLAALSPAPPPCGPRRSSGAARTRSGRGGPARAGDGRELELYYQPRLSLSTARHASTDAALRMTDRRHGAALSGGTPGASPAAGGVGLGGWILRAACLQAASWSGLQNVAVHVAACQVTEDALPRQVAAALDESGLAPERLELGLGEATLMSDDIDLLLSLSAIRDLGVSIALDDFGRCHASLTMLKRLPINVMRLDRLLVRGVPTDREDSAIIRAAVATGHAMGLTLVADGIESEDQRAFLSACGCDEGAGPLLGAPLPESGLHQLGFT